MLGFVAHLKAKIRKSPSADNQHHQECQRAYQNGMSAQICSVYKDKLCSTQVHGVEFTGY